MSETISVAIPIPTTDAFYYSVPAELQDGVEIGKRVVVPFRNRRALGFIVGVDKAPGDMELREVIDIIDDTPLFDSKRLRFFRWISEYYVASLGLVLKASHPGGLTLGLKNTVNITDSGLEAAQSGNVSGHEGRVLNTLKNSGVITTQKLLNLVDNTSHQLLYSLGRRGFLEFNYEFKSDPKIQYERVIVTRGGPDERGAEIRRKPAKNRIFEYVAEHKRVPYPHLKELFGGVGEHIKWLESKGFVDIELEEVVRDPFAAIVGSQSEPPDLTVDQRIASEKISAAIETAEFAPFLLHGVTGSGKTEVYMRAIAQVIANNKEAIFLVPEISLTPQLVSRLKGRFGADVAVIHSGLSEGERFDAWRRAGSGEVKIIIGARSAIFAPFKNIGIIVVDEEHESTYKQDETPSYNARDLALVLGKMTESVVVLGSATPSVESYNNARKKKFNYLSLPLRIGDTTLPKVNIADMRGKERELFSDTLLDAIKQNYEDGHQTILFINRRGYSSLLLCSQCGQMLTCPNCSIKLTYHRDDNTVRCHYCGLREPPAAKCRECGGRMRGIGLGTQRVEEELKKILPDARVARMDRDTVSGKQKLLSLYKRLEANEIDVLIGTQMVAKGHDLPGVTLVGVLSADQSLGIPDFRSGERTFQLITQVAGRSGRGRVGGNVIVQTYNPEHPSIKYAINQDSASFLKNETELRNQLDYPPFSKLVNIKMSGRREEGAKETAKRAEKISASMLSGLPAGTIELIGPSPSPIYKIKNRYRWQLLVKSKNISVARKFSRSLVSVLRQDSPDTRISIDIDPMNFS